MVKKEELKASQFEIIFNIGPVGYLRMQMKY